MIKEFKEFIMRGNVMDMAVGIIIGAAFSAIVNSLVKDIITPVIGLIFKADFTNLFWVMRKGGSRPGPCYDTDLAEAQAARRGDDELWQFHQLPHHLPHRRFRDLHADPGHQQNAPIGREAEGSSGTDNQRLPLLSLRGSHQSYPLSALHIRIENRIATTLHLGVLANEAHFAGLRQGGPYSFPVAPASWRHSCDVRSGF